MSISGKKKAITEAYNRGVRRCPCCNVQLVWRGSNNVAHPRNLATVDHIIPRSIGGSDSTENLFVMCRQCNEKRGTKCFIEYMNQFGLCPIEIEKRVNIAIDFTIKSLIFKSFVGQQSQKSLKTNLEKVVAIAVKFYGTLPEKYALIPVSKTYKLSLR